MLNDEKFEKVKAKAEADYRAKARVRCPYLSDDVHFTSAGLEHISLKAWNTPRSREDQYTRFRLLPLAVRVIEKSHTLQEYQEVKKFERVQSNSKWTKEMKLVRYYGFVAILDHVLIKVVVKEIEGRNKNFHSIIPKWRQEKVDGQSHKVLHKGNPEED
jgi:hypothetical protein